MAEAGPVAIIGSLVDGGGVERTTVVGLEEVDSGVGFAVPVEYGGVCSCVARVDGATLLGTTSRQVVELSEAGDILQCHRVADIPVSICAVATDCGASMLLLRYEFFWFTIGLQRVHGSFWSLESDHSVSSLVAAAGTPRENRRFCGKRIVTNFRLGMLLTTQLLRAGCHQNGRPRWFVCVLRHLLLR